jgi:glycosyltransferase WbpL
MIVFPILAFILTLVVTGAVRRYALRRALLDHPNHRSLHDIPTPRGGGVGIVLSVLAYLAYATASHALDRSLVLAIAGGGSLIAATGWIDDIRSVSPRTRLIAQFTAAAWAVWLVGGLPVLNVGAGQIVLGIAGAVAAVVLIVWITNLYNFMDGSDGLAGMEAVFIAGGSGLLLLTRGATSVATLSLVLFGAALGFLYWNWAPAKIFMGDVGSNFLGFTFGTLAIWSERTQTLPLLVWLILGAVFFVDASVTIVRRLRGGVWRYAHRTHAYQRAIRFGFSHAQIALIVGALDLVLVGLAVIATRRPTLMLAATLTALGLVGLYYIMVGRVHPFVMERPPS